MIDRRGPLFDRYVVVDWSAAAVPRLGADSIWIAEHGGAVENVATRAAAMRRLGVLLAERQGEGLRVLTGFDFPFGYPRGTAAALGLEGAPWRAIWDLLSERLADGEDNANNRFDVAAGLNLSISGEAFPFWGCPVGRRFVGLGPRRLRPHGTGDLPERRWTDAWPMAGRRGTPQPVWKLYTTGSVGSQALTGIARLAALRRNPALNLRIWPFETGLRGYGLDAPGTVLAEVYPSLWPVEVRDGEVKDAAQVRTAACRLAAADRAGELAAMMAGPTDLTAAQRRDIEREEAWILGMV